MPVGETARVATERRGEGTASGRGFAALVCLFMFLSTTPVLVQYPATLKYQSRGDHKEGLEAGLRSENAIVLISARADPRNQEQYASWPAVLRLGFFLPKNESEAHVRIRQVRDHNGYYVLDGVSPTAWTPASVNEFQWPTDIVTKIYEHQYPATGNAVVTKDDWMTGLGVVVGLGKAGAEPWRQMFSVAPAAFYHSTRPLDVARYRFMFRTNARAAITGSIKSPTGVEILSGFKYDAMDGIPFTVAWPIEGRPEEGWYQLSLDAKFAGLSQNVVVRFYHRGSLTGPQ